MSTPIIANLEKMLGGPRDGALLRYSLASEWLKAGDAAAAAARAREATQLDPNYSAAWKLLGKALVAAGEREAASAAYAEGIAVATARGDVQAAKEMTVFRRRLEAAASAAAAAADTSDEAAGPAGSVGRTTG